MGVESCDAQIKVLEIYWQIKEHRCSQVISIMPNAIYKLTSVLRHVFFFFFWVVNNDANTSKNNPVQAFSALSFHCVFRKPDSSLMPKEGLCWLKLLVSLAQYLFKMWLYILFQTLYHNYLYLFIYSWLSSSLSKINIPVLIFTETVILEGGTWLVILRFVMSTHKKGEVVYELWLLNPFKKKNLSLRQIWGWLIWLERCDVCVCLTRLDYSSQCCYSDSAMWSDAMKRWREGSES